MPTRSCLLRLRVTDLPRLICRCRRPPASTRKCGQSPCVWGVSLLDYASDAMQVRQRVEQTVFLYPVSIFACTLSLRYPKDAARARTDLQYRGLPEKVDRKGVRTLLAPAPAIIVMFIVKAKFHATGPSFGCMAVLIDLAEFAETHLSNLCERYTPLVSMM